MALSDGEAACGGDVWLRIATHRDHIKSGRVHHAAFGGNAIAPPKAHKRRPWERELSGRLRSKAGSVADISAHAEQYCEKNAAGGGKVFSGVIYSRVSEVRKSYENAISLNAHYTPLQSDPAHADLTFTGWNLESKEEKDRFTLWLSDQLYALYPAQLGQHLPNANACSWLVRTLAATRDYIQLLMRRAFHPFAKK